MPQMTCYRVLHGESLCEASLREPQAGLVSRARGGMSIAVALLLHGSGMKARGATARSVYGGSRSVNVVCLINASAIHMQQSGTAGFCVNDAVPGMMRKPDQLWGVRPRRHLLGQNHPSHPRITTTARPPLGHAACRMRHAALCSTHIRTSSLLVDQVHQVVCHLTCSAIVRPVLPLQ